MEPQRPECKTTVAQNIFINMMMFRRRGDRNLGHLHTYDHLTVLASGSLEVHCEGMTGVFKAPHLFLTPKDRAHQFYALEDNTVVACIHALRDPIRSDEILPPDLDPLVGGDLIQHVTQPDPLRTTRQPSEIDWVKPMFHEIAIPEAIGKASATRAVCANTEVEIIELSELDARAAIPATGQKRIYFLGSGAINIQTKVKQAKYTAPQVIILPANIDVEIIAMAPRVVIAKLNALRGDEEQPDNIPEEITLDHATEATRELLESINADTTEVEMFRSATFTSSEPCR